jgi:hypothetical protein
MEVAYAYKLWLQIQIYKPWTPILCLCTEVCDLSKPNLPEDAYAFYDYALQAKGLILKPMCGTGRFLLPLLEEGFDVYGFDASDHMLASLHAKAKVKTPTVWKGFVEDLEHFMITQAMMAFYCLKVKRLKPYHHLTCGVDLSGTNRMVR